MTLTLIEKETPGTTPLTVYIPLIGGVLLEPLISTWLPFTNVWPVAVTTVGLAAVLVIPIISGFNLGLKLEPVKDVFVTI